MLICDLCFITVVQHVNEPYVQCLCRKQLKGRYSVLPHPTKQNIIYTDNHIHAQCITPNNTKMLHDDTSSQQLTPPKHHKTRLRNTNPRILIQYRNVLPTRASRDPRKIQPTWTPLPPTTPRHRVDHREEGREGGGGSEALLLRIHLEPNLAESAAPILPAGGGGWLNELADLRSGEGRAEEVASRWWEMQTCKFFEGRNDKYSGDSRVPRRACGSSIHPTRRHHGPLNRHRSVRASSSCCGAEGWRRRVQNTIHRQRSNLVFARWRCESVMPITRRFRMSKII
jgi:hypothetical protein